MIPAALITALAACAAGSSSDLADPASEPVVLAAGARQTEPPPEDPAAGPRAPVEILDVDDLTAESVGAAGGMALAVVDGDEIRAADVLPVLFLTHTELIYAALEQAVRRKLMIKEARRLGVQIGSDVLDRNIAQVLKAQSDEFELAAGPGHDFEEYILERYGTSSAAYRAAVRSQVLEELFLTRLIRYEARTRDRIQVRVIVVEDIDLAKEIVDKLDDGANFAALARAHSIDRSGPNGGLLPPVERDCPHPLLADAANLKPGQRAEISVLEGKGRRLYRVLRLERVVPADDRPFASQAAEIEREVEALPIDPFEIAEWDRRVRERYPIEVRMGRA